MAQVTEEVLQDIYEHFRQTGDWPLVRELLVRYREGEDFRTFAARLGADRIVCQEGPTGVCFLPLNEISKRNNSFQDIALICRTLDFAATWFANKGQQAITQTDLATGLDVHGTALRRLGRLIQLERFVFSAGGSSSADMSMFNFVPSERALFFGGLTSFPDYVARVKKTKADERERERLQRRAYSQAQADYAMVLPDPDLTNTQDPTGPAVGPFIDPTRIAELRSASTSSFDLRRLVRLCEELDGCYRSKYYLSVAALTRALLDHVPPVFGAKTFAEVANNYRGAKSFRESMLHLEHSARRIGDAHLHIQIRSSESLPSANQVNFQNDLDVLLAEIVRILRTPAV